MLSRPGWSSSGPIQSLLAKSARGHAGDFPEHAGEMTLVGEAELSREIDKQSSLRVDGALAVADQIDV